MLFLVKRGFFVRHFGANSTANPAYSVQAVPADNVQLNPE